MSGIARRGVVAALVLLALLLAGCHRGPADGSLRFPHAPVILISIDTLRSDHLPAYGHRGVETPAIDALRAKGVLYRRAYSQVPLTLPSHVSILTGELPTVHGVRDNVGYRYDAKAHPDLATLLHAAGYRTGAAVSAYVLRPETGLATGFDSYDATVPIRALDVMAHSQRAGSETVAAALRWLEAGKGRPGPVFLWVHLYEPHAPYTPPEPFATRYREHPYDGEIAAADAALGELVAGLERLGLFDPAVLVLLSDHGEGLGDHGEQEHGILLYREALQVPLLLKLPGGARAGTTVDAPAQLVDVLPTILELVGVPAPAALPGRSLLHLPSTGRDIYAETYYPRVHFGWSELTSLVRDRFHYIDGPQPELFDLQSDLGERHDVLPQERREYAALRQALGAMTRELAAPGDVDAETARRLAALGYAAARVTASGPRPDPRSQLGALADLEGGLRLASEGRCEEAIPLFQRLLEKSPHVVDAWEHLGDCLQRSHQLPEARAAFARALVETRGAGRDAAWVANIDLMTGDLDSAEAHAQLAISGGSAPSGHAILAQVANARRDWPRAEREARAALVEATVTERTPARLALAIALFNQQRMPEAIASIDTALAERRSAGVGAAPGLHGMRGELLARAGRSAEATREYETEIQSFPSDPRPYVALALLAAADGDVQRATATLRRLVDSNGTPAAYVTAVRTLRLLGQAAPASELLHDGLTAHPDSKELRALAG